MNTHTNKNVICIKDIPSNLIEEAIFILKSEEKDESSSKTKSIRKEIILRETEDLVKEYSSEFEQIKIKNENKKNKKNDFKIKACLSVLAFILVCYLISIIK